jgi:mannose-1-phosphate guanylyltransferase
MIALILIGGMGTRLRPFTCDIPKPLLPVVNRPFLRYQFEILRRHGVKEAILCTSYKPEVFRRQLGDGRALGLRLRYVHEKTPLGTGGAIKNAAPFLNDTVLALNGDVLNAIDVTAFLKAHRLRRADLSIALTRVKDPTLYGVVETAPDGRIRKFVEKPSWDELESNTVNAGAYLFEPTVLKRIPPGVNYSLERSLFPQLLADGARLFGYVSPGYWIDIGTVEKYLQVHLDILGGLTPFQPQGRKNGRVLLGQGARLGRELTIEPSSGRVVLGTGAVVKDFARLARNVCIGARCEIGRGASLEDCLVLEGARIGDGARLERCIVGPDAAVGAHCLLGPGVALAGGSVLKPYSQL